MRNHSIDNVSVKPIRFTKQVQPNEIIDLEVVVDIPEKISRENLVLMFQLEDSHREVFGDAMVGIVDIVHDKEQLEILKTLSVEESIN